MKKPNASKALIDDLVAASRILARHGVLDAYGHVSARSDKRPDRFVMSRSRAPALVSAADIMEHDADSDYRHELEMDLEPFKGLLLAVFFISVGSGIDFTLLATMPGVLLGIVLGFMALKFAVLWLLAVMYKMQRADVSRFASSLAQGGEFAFVLVSFALVLGLLTSAEAGLLVAYMLDGAPADKERGEKHLAFKAALKAGKRADIASASTALQKALGKHDKDIRKFAGL